ncbi:MAG: hypothetical protein K2M75_04710, partial [Clostridia bacterium]|nr:hypothetical protein [Clostridia bacterium]
MNLSKNKSRLLGLTSIILILLVAFSFVFMAQSGIKAKAGKITVTNETGILPVNELLKTDRDDTATSVGDKSIFDINTLTNLFEALTGVTGATLNDVKNEMAKSQYNSGKAGDGTYTPNTSTNDYSNAKVGSIHYGMNAQDIRGVTGGKNIEVKFGGQTWEVATLTTTGDPSDVSKGDVVLTLLLKDAIDGYKTYWNGWQTATSNIYLHTEKYASSFYSSSMIRSIILNGKGSDGKDVMYTEDGNTLVKLGSGTKATPIANYDSTWAIFTDINAKKNVTKFLVKPKDVLYMQDENLYDVDNINQSNKQEGSGQNEAAKNKLPSSLGTPTNGYNQNRWYNQYNSQVHVHLEQEKSVYDTNINLGGGVNLIYNSANNDPTYFTWADDLMWLPSWAEVGRGGTGSEAGLWGLNNSQRTYSNSSTTANQYWLRSGKNGSSDGACVVATGGGTTLVNTRLSELAIRPAINLNLTSAAKSTATKLPAPTNVEVEYTGRDLDLDAAVAQGTANWWTDDVKDRVKATYYKDQVQGYPKEIDTYTVKLSLKDTKDSWGDSTKDDKTIEYKVVPRKLQFPKWDTTNGGAKPFRGSAGVTFDLYYDSDFLSNLNTLTGKDYFDLVDVTTPTDITKQSGGWKYKAIDAKKYDLTFTLKDTARYEWAKGAPSDGKLPFEVTKKIINVTLTADDGVADSLTGREGNSVNAVLTIPPNQIEVGYDAKITIRAKRSSAAPSDVSKVITLNDTSGSESITLDLSDVSANSNLYNLSIDCSSAEYEFVVTNTPTLKVDEDNKNVLRWQLYVGGKAQVGYYIDCDIDDTTKTVTFDKKTIYYTGKYAEFKASATPMGYSLKTTSYNGGYEMNTTDPMSTNTKKGINADDYTTIVDVYKNDDTSVVVTFKINWTIAPALFDMSGVKWLNNGDLPYDGGLAVSAEIDTNTLPKGLKVQAYYTNQGANVTDSGTAGVEFELDPAYDGNYVLPVKPDPTDPTAPATYTGTFNWDQPWQVVPRTISTASWQSVNHPDSGKNFNILQLKDPAANTIVDYTYYETDSHGVIPSGAVGLTVNDLELPADGAKWYVAVPNLTDSNNYKFDKSNPKSRPFMVGAINASIIRFSVEPAKTEFAYNTQPRQIVVQTTGANLNNGYFDVAYFKEDGYTLMDGAPIECGNYWVEITLKTMYSNRFAQEGDTKFEFSIVPAEIDPNWIDTARPPVLKLEYGQIYAL